MTTKGAETVVQRQLDAYNAHDIAGFAACFAEDVSVLELGDGSVICEGREALRDLYGPLFERCPNLHARLVNRIASGEMIVDHESVTGMDDRAPFEAIAIYEVMGGLVTRVWFA